MENSIYMALLTVNMGSLLVNTVLDMHTREVSMAVAGITGFCGLIWRIYMLNFLTADALLGLVPGVICLILARVTRESVGYGDGWVLLAAGIGLGGRYMVSMCMIALLLAGICALILIVCFHKGRKYQLPLLPFLLAGYLSTLAYIWL